MFTEKFTITTKIFNGRMIYRQNNYSADKSFCLLAALRFIF